MTTHPPDGLLVVAKADCPTCRLVEPLLAELADAGPLRVYVQDSSDYASELPGTVYDKTLEHSWRLETEFVPTLIRVQDGQEVSRTYGWDKSEWRTISGLSGLGEDLPVMRPGCGSKTACRAADPGPGAAHAQGHKSEPAGSHRPHAAGPGSLYC